MILVYNEISKIYTKTIQLAVLFNIILLGGIMEEAKLEELKSILEETVSDAMEDKIEELSDIIQEKIEECTSDVLSEFIEESIDEFLQTHQFQLPDGTIVKSRNRTKVMSPNGKMVLNCYGGLRVDGKTLMVQERLSSWRGLCYFETETEAVEALKKVNDAIEQGVSLIKL
jgi:hypothetical protein